MLGCGSSAGGATGPGDAAATVGTGAYGGGCPATAPSGGACPVEGRVCTYGDVPRIECRVQATCKGGQWAVKPAMTCPTAAPPDQCPASAPLAGGSCDARDRTCRYPNGAECLCWSPMPPALAWTCNPPPNNPAPCPLTPPNGGTTCTAGNSCNYNCGPLSGQMVSARCQDGLWELAVAPCAQTGG